MLFIQWGEKASYLIAKKARFTESIFFKKDAPKNPKPETRHQNQHNTQKCASSTSFNAVFSSQQLEKYSHCKA